MTITDAARACVPAGVREASAPNGLAARAAQREWRLAAILALCVVLAAAVRLPLLSGQRFHPDEALYATWARWIATGQDVWLSARVVDKPPLFFYTLAVPFATIGASEEIARIPDFAASIFGVVLTALIALELYRDARIAGMAALGMALSPIAMLYSATAFTDPFMLAWTLAAALAALRGKWAWCGLWWGLALATKQDAILAAPLLAAIAWSHARGAQSWRPFRALALGLLPPVVAVVLWTMVRPQPDFLSASLLNYGTLTFLSGERLIQQSTTWIGLASSIAPGLLLLVSAVTAVAMRGSVRHAADFWLPIIALAWMLVHVVVSFPAWDRYALPLAPLAAIWLARTGAWLYDHFSRRALRLALAITWAISLLLPARDALAGEVRVGRDFDRHAGIDEIGSYFWKADTTATVLYVHDLSWEVDYYTFGRELDRRWFPDAQALAADAAHMTWAKRFVVLADWEPARNELPAALAGTGLSARPVLVTTRPDGHAAVYLMQIAPIGP